MTCQFPPAEPEVTPSDRLFGDLGIGNLFEPGTTAIINLIINIRVVNLTVILTTSVILLLLSVKREAETHKVKKYGAGCLCDLPREAIAPS